MTKTCIEAYDLIKSIWPSSELTLIETPIDLFKSEIKEFQKRRISYICKHQTKLINTRLKSKHSKNVVSVETGDQK